MIHDARVLHGDRLHTVTCRCGHQVTFLSADQARQEQERHEKENRMQVRLITHGKPVEAGQSYPIDETGNRIRPGTRLTDVTVIDPMAVVIVPGREFDMLRINDLDGIEVGATYEVAK